VGDATARKSDAPIAAGSAITRWRNARSAPSPHLESVRAGDRIVDHPTHFQPHHLAGDHTVLDHDVGTTLPNGVHEHQMIGRRSRFG